MTFVDSYNNMWDWTAETLAKGNFDLSQLDDDPSGCGLSDAVRILNCDPEKNLQAWEEIVKKAQQKRTAIFEKRIFPIVPLYVSSICEEGCLYCNYREGNSRNVDRLRLTDAELYREVEFLVSNKELRAIELVYSSDPDLGIDSICKHISLTKKCLEKYGGGVVGINAQAMKTSDYKKMLSSGLDFCVLWQETYDRNVYSHMHPGKKKKTHFEGRLEAYERMLQAGIRHIGMGVLSGLANWRHDWAMLLAHQDYILKHYSVDTIIIGLPRLKEAEGAVVKTSEYVPTDKEFLLCLAAQSLYAPDSVPFVNTRESWRFCLEASAGGGVLFTFNCSTIPGGYTLGHSGEQFPTSNFDIEHFADKIANANMQLISKWSCKDMCLSKKKKSNF